MRVIHPVLRKVPETFGEVPRKERAAALSALAREALFQSAKKCGVLLACLEKDDRGAPLPFEGIHWSISHKDTFVAGVVAPSPVGIDIEKIRPVSSALFQKTGTDEEWALGGDGGRELLFFRYWTAKEAALKTTGVGFSEFSDCRITRIINDHRLILQYRDREWLVEQFFIDGHVAAVIKEGWEVAWHIEYTKTLS